MGSPSSTVQNYMHLMLNPGNSYNIAQNDVCFFISSSKEDVDDFYNLKPEEISLLEQSFNTLFVEECSIKDQDPQIKDPRPSVDSKGCEMELGYPPAPHHGAKVSRCFLSKKENEIKDIIIEDANYFQTPHILALVENYENLFFFVAQLRSAILPDEKRMPIVFLGKSLPSTEEWSKISCFPDLFIVLGDYRFEVDLERAAPNKADKIIIFSRTCTIPQQQDDADDFSDGGAM